MRALLIVLMLGPVAGVLGACVSETVPDDLLAGDSPEATSKGRDAGKGAPKGGAPSNDAPPEAPAPGGPDAPTDAGAGTPPSDAGSGTGPGKDAGKAPPPAPTTPFKRMDIRYPVATGDYILQCALDAKTQLVWKSNASGTDANARFADPAYVQPPNVHGGCGAKVNGEYPLVFTSLADGALPAGTYVVKCSSSTRGDVYRVSGALEGHPSATFMYDEAHQACAGQ